MYRVAIIYGLLDVNGKEFERVLDDAAMPIANDLDMAKEEAERFLLWNGVASSYHHAAEGASLPPAWKQHTVNKKRVYDKKFDIQPKRQTEETGQYVIVRISKV